MTRYVHPDLPDFLSPSAFTLDGIQYPRVWWRTVEQSEISALGFVEYVPPESEPVEPSTNPADYPLSPVQFKALVVYLNKDSEIRSLINQIPDDMQRAFALSKYENASVYLWDDPLFQQIKQNVNMTEEELEAAWMLAKDLV